ncbi:hypothetical protein PYCC9005_005239 [Savitreella phatthalungensis]
MITRILLDNGPLIDIGGSGASQARRQEARKHRADAGDRPHLLQQQGPSYPSAALCFEDANQIHHIARNAVQDE